MPPRSDRAHAHRMLAVGLLAGACALGAVISIVRQRTADATSEATGAPGPPGSGEIAEWCAPGFEAVAGGGCLAISAAAPAAPRVVVYLHGRYARTAPGDEID